jgi:hypothetical protein
MVGQHKSSRKGAKAQRGLQEDGWEPIQKWPLPIRLLSSSLRLCAFA